MSEAITIRHSTDRDTPRVLQLAELDDSSAVADPFRPAGDLVWLPQVRAEQERLSRAA